MEQAEHKKAEKDEKEFQQALAKEEAAQRQRDGTPPQAESAAECDVDMGAESGGVVEPCGGIRVYA